MTTKEMIAVMQASEEGKTIEYRRIQDTGPLGQWSEHPGNPAWAWDTHEYRLKPEPVETIAWEKHGRLYFPQYHHESARWEESGHRKVKLREVIE